MLPKKFTMISFVSAFKLVQSIRNGFLLVLLCSVLTSGEEKDMKEKMDKSRFDFAF
jgi:hypothetical protein